jgi:hypothetical protein
MEKLTVMLTPEGETLWIRRPELLLLTDKVFMDKQDYERIINRSARSQFDAKISALLEAYAHEGYVEIVDFPKQLSINERDRIYSVSKDILDGMSFRERKQAGIYGHQQYSNYLGAILEHLNADEPLFISKAKARRGVLTNIKTLSNFDEKSTKYPENVAEMQRRAISKWLAAEILARKFDSNFIFDLDEYRPYAKRIRERLLINDKPVETQSLFSNDQAIPFRIMWEVINTNLPGISLDSTDDLLRFKPSRKEFEAFRQILRDLIQFHQEVQDEAILFNYATRRFKDAQDQVQNLFNKIPQRFMRCVPSCLAFLLNKVWIPASPDTIRDFVQDSQARDMFNRVQDAYEKLCCFSMYANRTPLPEAKIADNDAKSDEHHWVTGAPLSWYETPLKRKDEQPDSVNG